MYYGSCKLKERAAEAAEAVAVTPTADLMQSRMQNEQQKFIKEIPFVIQLE